MTKLLISCDWGTSRFRLRAVRLPMVEILAQVDSDQGVAALAGASAGPPRAERFRAALEQALETLAQRCPEPLAGATVVISGMASSSIGWHELAYARLPLALDGRGLNCRELTPAVGSAGAHPVLLISGACTDSDVMRGEETEALGVYHLPAARDWAERSLLVLPGTHSKHLEITAGQITTFRTFMTGELFDVLANHSILRHSTQFDGVLLAASGEQYRDDFRQGVECVRQHPLTSALFRVRTRQLLDRRTPESNRAFLSGLLLGAELGYLAGEANDATPIVLCAAGALRDPYLAALETLGLNSRLRTLSSEDAARTSAVGQAALLRNLGA